MTEKQDRYIAGRIEQLKEDMSKAHSMYDKAWYNRIIQELSWVQEMKTKPKTNCYMEKDHVGAIGGKEIWT